jgi:hypothetical protein
MKVSMNFGGYLAVKVMSSYLVISLNSIVRAEAPNPGIRIFEIAFIQLLTKPAYQQP